MSEDKNNENECFMDTTDSQGNPNLCCCYAIDEDGNYTDPCYIPVDECCCCQGSTKSGS